MMRSKLVDFSFRFCELHFKLPREAFSTDRGTAFEGCDEATLEPCTQLRRVVWVISSILHIVISATNTSHITNFVNKNKKIPNLC